MHSPIKIDTIRSKAGWVYVIQDEKNDPQKFKIGQSVNPESRLRQAGTWLREPKIVRLYPSENRRFRNPKKAEDLIHAELRAYQVKGDHRKKEIFVGLDLATVEAAAAKVFGLKPPVKRLIATKKLPVAIITAIASVVACSAYLVGKQWEIF